LPSQHLSFIVPLFNHVEESKVMLKTLIETIPANTNYEIILINDASNDGTKDWLNTLQLPHVKIIHNETNQGFAKTNNIAVRQALGEILVLLNNDLVFDSDWLTPMLNVLNTEDLKAGVVGNIQYRVINDEIDHAGVALSHKSQFIHKDNFDADKLYSKQLAVTGACMMIKKSDFDSVSGFSEEFVNGCEDLDLCFKLKSQGLSIYLSHKSQIHHHVSLSRDITHPQNEMNSRHLLQKWRQLIKQELSLRWSRVITNNDEAVIQEHIDGKLLIDSPHTASRMIAENLIGREEHRWEKLFDKKDFKKELNEKCSVKGLKYVESHTCYLINDDIEFRVKDIESVVNFYMVGQVINLSLNEDILITIRVNDFQEKNIYLDREENINAGVIYPMFMPGIDNLFKVSVNFFNRDTKEILGDARKSIVVRYFVVDDSTITM
jgi:GT2 family glycosyltransferase